MSGLIAGGQSGVAPGASLIGLKVLDAEGQGRASDVISALDWVVKNKVRYNIQVVNLSLGHPIYEPAATDPLVQAVEQAVAAGLKVMVSAGNLARTRRPARSATRASRPPATRLVGDHGWRVHDVPDRQPPGRPHGVVQLAGAVLVRRVCEARHRGAGRRAEVGPRTGQHAGQVDSVAVRRDNR